MSDTGKVKLGLRLNGFTGWTEATRVAFSAHQCFRFDGCDTEKACLEAIAAHLERRESLALWGSDPMLEALLETRPTLAKHIIGVITDDSAFDTRSIPRISPSSIPQGIETVFLCDTLSVPRMRQRKLLESRFDVIDADIVLSINPTLVPRRSWVTIPRTIYPIELPEIKLDPGNDMVLIDCPSRNLALMPNGLAYVHNAIKKTGISFQTLDVDIIVYHEFHIRRLFDEGGTISLASGRELPVDPWQTEHYGMWSEPEIVEHFREYIDKLASQIVHAAPKVIGFSLQECSMGFVREVIRSVRPMLPDAMVVVGGFSCYSHDIGRRDFPECDYMCIGEADLTIGPLVEALVGGERPKNLPGILSRFDDPDHRFSPAPMPHDLDLLDHCHYDWTDISIYRNFNGYQLVPVLASRGCRWSRCTFCAERFFWRVRSAEDFVDELEWLIAQGCDLFMFNESDLNGQPDRLLEICDEVIARGLPVRFGGQLRINKLNTREFFEKLKKAGFVSLRFGVDAFSDNTLKLQKKGYTREMIRNNLRDCSEVGIYTEVNWVIGVPGETEEDIDESIELILECREWISRLANINTLALANGSVYWLDPESHGIKFHGDKDEIYKQHCRGLPPTIWYSENPHIDHDVREARFNRTVRTLYDQGFPVGPWASRLIEDKTGQHAEDNLAGDTYSPSEMPTMRADSALGESRVEQLPSDQSYLRGPEGTYYAVPADVVDLFCRKAGVWSPGNKAVGAVIDGFEIRRAISLPQTLECIGQADGRTIYSLDGRYYGVPNELKVDWESPDLDENPEILYGSSMYDILRQMRPHGISRKTRPAARKESEVSSSSTPVEVGRLEGYKILEYEGWFYGIPEDLSQVDLTREDVLEREGVIRDISKAVIESEILEAKPTPSLPIR